MDTWLRVLLYVVLAIAPTALFLGLWNGLYRLRDDELTRQALERADSSPARRTLAGRMMFGSTDQYDRVDLDGLTSDGSDRSVGGGSSLSSPEQEAGESRVRPDDEDRTTHATAVREPVVCAECGAPNDPGFDRCAECLADL